MSGSKRFIIKIQPGKSKKERPRLLPTFLFRFRSPSLPKSDSNIHINNNHNNNNNINTLPNHPTTQIQNNENYHRLKRSNTSRIPSYKLNENPVTNTRRIQSVSYKTKPANMSINKNNSIYRHSNNSINIANNLKNYWGVSINFYAYFSNFKLQIYSKLTQGPLLKIVQLSATVCTA